MIESLFFFSSGEFFLPKFETPIGISFEMNEPESILLGARLLLNTIKSCVSSSSLSSIKVGDAGYTSTLLVFFMPSDLRSTDIFDLLAPLTLLMLYLFLLNDPMNCSSEVYYLAVFSPLRILCKSLQRFWSNTVSSYGFLD